MASDHVTVCHQCYAFATAGPAEFALQGKECQKKHWKAHKPFCRGGSLSHELVSAFAKQTGINAVPQDASMPVQDTGPLGARGIVITCLPPAPGQDIPGGSTDCALASGLKERILALPGFPRPVPSPSSPAHRIAHVPGAGLGMFATRCLVAGELVFAERPIIIMPQGMLPLSFKADKQSVGSAEYKRKVLKDAEDMVGMLISRSLPDRARAYLNLGNAGTFEGAGPLMGILQTNSWAITAEELKEAVPETLEDDPLVKLAGVCDTLSRINHSPNSMVTFDLKSFSFVLCVLRDIDAGTPITVSYVHNIGIMSAAERQRDLGPYAFKCTCMSCVSPAISDLRRKEIADTPIKPHKLVGPWLYNAHLPDDYLTQPSLRVLRLVTEEGLEFADAYMQHLVQLASAYVALGDRKNYLWAHERIMQQVDANPRNGYGADKSKFPENPETHGLWRRRVKAKAS
ncbi:hypothetical protein EWM64_g1166 [Hericium alpestre]|uniref:SET domain-containing protein n=1 Tax=Hericium alpestre TaxID=135208 RepID=A0A4Z0A939_9AGAM|nr:hypothetical protein EWM64_g1166 [Hericium alpestre]